MAECWHHRSGEKVTFSEKSEEIYISSQKKLENVCFLPKSQEKFCQKIYIKPDYARGIAQI